MENKEYNIYERAYKDPEFKKQLKANPREVLKESLKIDIPQDVEIKVVENTPKSIYLVIPCAEEYSDETLAEISGGMRNQWNDAKYNPPSTFQQKR